jgi:DNA primase
VLIPEHKIQEVLDRVDLVELVGRHVELKKAGRSFKGRCPFHQEKTPSFQVTPEMRRFKCFGCGVGGDAISFLQRLLGKSFVDAVRDLAREAGVDLESAQDPAALERERIKEATDVAFEHFRERLHDPEGGKFARDYVASRGVSEEMVKAFGLGWAPSSWSDLADKLRARGILDFGLLAGLVRKREHADGYYDLFRSRLIIPIRSPEGRCIAFGGRLLEPPGAEKTDGPKYLNSRESKLYNKSDVLYGTDQAREEIRRKKAAVLVEGYFDCIGLHQVGVKHAVALCSTALTPGHLALLSRLEAKELLLLLDGDEAGRKAVERLGGPILAAGASAKVALLPEGEDPDTFARRVGLAGVTALLASARPLSEHLLVTVLPQGVAATFEEKMAALERLKPVSAALPLGLTRSAFISSLARHFGLPAAELETALKGKAAHPLKAVPKTSVAAPARERPADPLEATFVAYGLRQPSLLGQDDFQVADELLHPGLRTCAARLAQGHPASDILYEASEATRRALDVASRNLPPEEGQLLEAFGQVTRKLKLRRIDDQLVHIAKVTGQVQRQNEQDDELLRLMSERVALLALRKRVVASTSGLKPLGPTV